MAQYGGIMQSVEDTSNEVFFDSFTHNFLVGMSYDETGHFFAAFNVVRGNFNLKGQGDSSKRQLNLLELGPRALFFLNPNKNIYFSIAWHLYSKGTEKLISGGDQKVSGRSLLYSLGLQFVIANNISFGFSLNYHFIKMSEKDVQGTKTEINDRYNLFYPLIEFSFRPSSYF